MAKRISRLISLSVSDRPQLFIKLSDNKRFDIAKRARKTVSKIEDAKENVM